LKNHHFEGQNLDFSRDLVDFAPKQRFSETVEGPHLRFTGSGLATADLGQRLVNNNNNIGRCKTLIS
jgi:hypothetical protein